jgi:dTDP-4-dehydrorhamnose 3,5-epimerase
MKAERLELPDVVLIKPRIFHDDRGRFVEAWRDSTYRELGIGPFVQDNVSVSRRNVLRGLHFQHPHGQGKLVSALRGRIVDVAVDVRTGSPTFGRWVGRELSDENGWQLYVPPGFAHGFMALSDEVVFSYKCTDYYTPASERTIRWNDPDIGIDWPVANPLVAPKDADAPTLAELATELLPPYASTRARPRAVGN